MTDNVKVAVRVRPFNKREVERDAKLCIQMDGQETIISDDAGNERKFTFDYRCVRKQQQGGNTPDHLAMHSYWSHDGYEEDSDGQLAATGDVYADQQKVFGDLGNLVLENAWSGQYTTLQTNRL